ncbi:MAG: hypothetical protein AAAC48_29125 [Phyllobacterium sp.]
MHIVLAILGLLGGGLFWWYRLKILSEGLVMSQTVWGVCAVVSGAGK